MRVDGHDPEAIAAAIERARRSDKPSLIACKTIIGYGAPTKQGKASTHGEPLGAEEIKGAREKLGWPHAAVRGAGRRARGLARRRARAARPQRKAWEQRAAKLDARKRAALGDPMRCRGARKRSATAVAEIKAEFAADAAQDRHPRRLAEGAGEARAGAALPDRRLGRPHRLQRHAHQAPQAPSRPATSAATTSTTACASTPWPRP